MLDITARNNHFIHSYSKNNQSFQSELIRKGDGPLESFSAYTIDFHDQKIMVHDFDLKKVVEINFENGKTEISEFKTDKYFNEIKYFNDSTFIATSSAPSKAKFHFINRSSMKTSFTKGSFDKIPKEIEVDQIPVFFQSIMGVNKTNNKVLNAYRWLDIIEIFDINTDQSSYLQSPQKIRNQLVRGIDGKLTLDRGNGAIECYTDIAYTDLFIYALFSGKKDTEPNAYLSNLIHIYDWKGNPIKQITTDRNIMSISVVQTIKQSIRLTSIKVKLFILNSSLSAQSA